MQGQARMMDIAIGIGTHGSICCPHPIMSMPIISSPTVMTNMMMTTRAFDMMVHTCPHCPMGMAIMGSKTKLVNMLPAHRRGDTTCEMCGSGTMIGGSPNVLVGG